MNVDTFDVAVEPQSKNLKILNIVCEGTSLQMVIPLWGGATAKNTFKVFRKHWIRWAGSPKRLLSDGGPEFGEDFQEGCDRFGIYTNKTAAESPWQNGMCERHGGVWKEVFHKACEECIPRIKAEYNELFDKVNESKNSMMSKHGFSPY